MWTWSASNLILKPADLIHTHPYGRALGITVNQSVHFSEPQTPRNPDEKARQCGINSNGCFMHSLCVFLPQ